MSKTKKFRTKMRGWFSNPWVGLFGTIFSILGVTIAIYIYLSMKTERKLTYYIHPVKAIVLKSGKASCLRVLYDNREIKTDVTTTQVAIWNRGRKSIRTGDILSGVKILTEPRVPILEATIRKYSRSIIEFSLDKSDFAEGEVPISWKILEQNDGVVIQLTYAGPPTVNIAVEGTLEGQSRIFKVGFPGKIKSASEQFIEQKKENRRDVVIFFILFILFSTYNILKYTSMKKKKKSPPDSFDKWFLRMGLFQMFLILGALIYFLIILMRTPAPPFGF